MRAVFKHELSSYFTGLTAYVFNAFILFFAGMYCMVYNLKSGYSNFEYVVSSMCIVFVIIVPIMTMRVIAEEKKQKTDQLLFSLPISMSQVVLGKFFALVVVFLVSIAIMATYPLILSSFGTVNLKTAYSSLTAFFFLGCSLLSVGMFLSSITENQAVAAGLCFIVMLLNYYISPLTSYVSSTSIVSLVVLAVLAAVVILIIWLMTRNLTVTVTLAIVSAVAILVLYSTNSSSFSGLLPTIMASISLFDCLDEFINGVFDITKLVYLASVTAVFLYLTTQSLEKRRWS